MELKTTNREVLETKFKETFFNLNWHLSQATSDNFRDGTTKWYTSRVRDALQEIKKLLNRDLDNLSVELSSIELKHKEARVGVSVIIFNSKGKVLVGKRKGSHGAGLLSVPGGHLEYMESINTACDRELIEEIGVNFEGNYKQIGFSEDLFGEKHYVTLYLIANASDEDATKIKNMEPNKCEGWEWKEITELPKEMFCDTYNQIMNHVRG